MEVRVLYEDPYLLAVEKPRGVLSQPDETGDESLLDAVRRYQTENGDKYMAEPIHRLDRGTGGVILYAKGASMASKLSAILRDRKVEKEYLAVVDGAVEGERGEWRDYLLHDARRNLSRVVPEGTEGAKEAVSRWEKMGYTLIHGCMVTLLRVELLTGRTHQIRVQASSRGMPLLGDGKYGSKTGGPLGLWAWRIRMIHPMNRRETVVVTSLPTGEPFERFVIE